MERRKAANENFEFEKEILIGDLLQVVKLVSLEKSNTSSSGRMQSKESLCLQSIRQINRNRMVVHMDADCESIRNTFV